MARQAATVYATVAQLKTTTAPSTAKYARTIEGNALWKYVVGSTATVNDTDAFPTVLNPAAAYGGTAGRWLRVGSIPRLGADLTDASVTISITGGAFRRLPASTLGANRVLTLQTADAFEGDTLRITRLDTGAYTYAIADEEAGTLVTLPVSQAWFAEVYFDESLGTAGQWILTAAGQMP